MQKRIAFKDLCAVISLTVIFTSSIANILNPAIGYAVLAVWVAWGLFKLFNSGDEALRNTLTTVLKGNLNIKIVIHVYTIALVFLGLTESRFLSANLQTYLNALSAVCIYCVLKENTLLDSLIALGLTFIIAVITQINTGYIRVHDLSFGAEYVLIYFFVIQNRLNKKNLKWIILSIIVLYVSNKDIQILGFVMVFLIKHIHNLLSPNAQIKFLKIYSMLLVFGIYAYLYWIIEGNFFDIIKEYGVSTSGRNYYYLVAREMSDFSLSFRGLGRNAMQVLFANEYSYMHVGNIHSDILRMYVECGFICFTLWVYNYFVYFPKLINKLYGTKSMIDYTLLIGFTFFSYFTDNIELYVVAQYFFVLILLVSLLENKKNKKET